MVIVLAVDGHPHSQAIFEQLGRTWQIPTTVSRLIVVTVVDTTYQPGAAFLDFGDGSGTPSQAKVHLRQAEEPLKPWQDRVEYLVLKGEPGPQIVKLLRETKAELVVTGRGRHHAHDRALLGSVSAHVVDQAPCTVAVVKGP